MCHNDDGLRTKMITRYALNIESFGHIAYRRRGASVCMIFYDEPWLFYCRLYHNRGKHYPLCCIDMGRIKRALL
jgi:hypothetical protein